MVSHTKSRARFETEAVLRTVLDGLARARVASTSRLLTLRPATARRASLASRVTGRAQLLMLLAGFVLASATWLYGQSTNSSLSGTVKDPGGAAIPGAHLTLTAGATGAVRQADAGDDGFYRFSNLQAGIYTLKVSVAGFAPFTQVGIVLALNEAAPAHVTVSVDTATE